MSIGTCFCEEMWIGAFFVCAHKFLWVVMTFIDRICVNKKCVAGLASLFNLNVWRWPVSLTWIVPPSIKWNRKSVIYLDKKIMAFWQWAYYCWYKDYCSQKSQILARFTDSFCNSQHNADSFSFDTNGCKKFKIIHSFIWKGISPQTVASSQKIYNHCGEDQMSCQDSSIHQATKRILLYNDSDFPQHQINLIDLVFLWLILLISLCIFNASERSTSFGILHIFGYNPNLMAWILLIILRFQEIIEWKALTDWQGEHWNQIFHILYLKDCDEFREVI